MKKFAMSLTALTVIAGGLAGCGAGDEGNEMGAAPTRYNDTQDANNMGTRNTTNYNRNYRGEGPLTDMMSVDDRNNNRNGSQQMQIGNGSGTTDMREGTHARNTGLAGNTGMTRNTNMNNNAGQNNAGDGDLHMSRRIANEVESIDGIDDASVIVRGQDVIVGIDTYEGEGNKGNNGNKGNKNGNNSNGENNNKSSDLVSKVENKVKQTFDNEDVQVYVTDDEEQFGNIEDVGKDLQNGLGMNEVGETIDSMISDLGSAASQPFRDS